MQHDLEVQHARTYDPGRGYFCDTDRNGQPLPIPPVQREPNRDREANPRGTRHINKSRQDRQPVSERTRVHEANARRQRMENG